MNILHYTIGLPPKRHGGSVQYAYDLMQEQARQGHNVLALTCGDTLFRSSKSKIKTLGLDKYIKIYVLTNPTTPTLLYGVKNPASQMRNVRIDKSNIRSFIVTNRIEILHIHTFMGLPKNVIEFIKTLGVKIIYTTHDFYGICPKNNLLYLNGKICDKISGERCSKCCFLSPSDSFLRLCNSSIYQTLKRFKTPKKSVIRHLSRDHSIELNQSDIHIDEYNQLIEYYRDYFELVDCFHFNSTQTMDIFKEYLPTIKGLPIPVTTSKIRDQRRIHIPSTPIVFAFVGSLNEYKGFPMLKSALIDLESEGYSNFKLKVYGTANSGIDETTKFIEYCGHYDYRQLSDILYNLDLIIVPSKWYETFSLITLESLSHGIPVLVSNTVGAKEIIKEIDDQFIFTDMNSLKKFLRKIIMSPQILIDFNKKIRTKNFNWTIDLHTKKIENVYSNAILL